MKVKIYFDTEEVATFNDEDTYIKCLPSLEAEAERLGMTLIESLEDEKAWFHKAEKILSGGYWYAKIADIKLGNI
jgi:hypothetical protein|tara:strand:+ start:587 stop:811 length:225 start_codon:yes stop_codon:yes gene_type:complete